MEVSVDGTSRVQLIARAAPAPPVVRDESAWLRLRPCPNEASGTMRIDTARLADGAHDVRLRARDPAGQATQSGPATVLIDNTPPGTPSDAIVEGGDGWRRANSFNVRWENPIEAHAPIVAARWRLCPVAGGSCTAGRATGSAIRRLGDLTAAAGGEHDLAIWLEDEAGNHDPDRARHLRLRLDTEAPRLSLRRTGPRRPTACVRLCDRRAQWSGGGRDRNETPGGHQLAPPRHESRGLSARGGRGR